MSKPSDLFGSLFEVILYVSDMNAQVAFYRDTLGFTLTYPDGLDDYSAEFWGKLNTGGCILAQHAGGGKDFGKDAAKIVFKSDHINETRDYLIEKGVPVSEINSPAPGVRVFDALDPEGNAFFVNGH